MSRTADADFPIHDLIARRWSGRAFADQPVEPEVLRSLFEAARWAPSSRNQQPWRFIVARREDEDGFAMALESLAPANRRWAKDAPVIVLALAEVRYVFEGESHTNRHAFHDVGQAVAMLSLQATAHGLNVHQLGGFSPQTVRELFEVPDDVEPVTAIALGYPGEADALPDDLAARERAPRRRLGQDEFVFGGRFGEAFAGDQPG